MEVGTLKNNKIITKKSRFSFLSNDHDKYGHYGFFFVIPFFIFLSIFVIYPIIYSFKLSFTRWDGSGIPKFIGLENFKYLLFQDPLFFKTLSNTLIIWICSVIPQMVMALIFAVILTTWKVKGTGFFRAVFFLPNLITMASIAVLFWFIFGWDGGVLNSFLVNLGIIKENYNFLGNPWSLRLTISFALFWMWFGYTMIIFMAGINAIPEDIYEAAHVDGVSKWQLFKCIILPLLRPIMLYQVVTSIIGGFTMFDMPYVLSNPRGGVDSSAETVVMYIYNRGFLGINGYGYAATMGTVLFFISLIFVVIAFRFLNKNPND